MSLLCSSCVHRNGSVGPNVCCLKIITRQPCILVPTGSIFGTYLGLILATFDTFGFESYDVEKSSLSQMQPGRLELGLIRLWNARCGPHSHRKYNFVPCLLGYIVVFMGVALSLTQSKQTVGQLMRKLAVGQCRETVNTLLTSPATQEHPARPGWAGQQHLRGANNRKAGRECKRESQRVRLEATKSTSSQCF